MRQLSHRFGLLVVVLVVICFTEVAPVNCFPGAGRGGGGSTATRGPPAPPTPWVPRSTGSFDEALWVQPLANYTKALLHFRFITTTATRVGHHHHHYDLFPKSLGQVMDKFELAALRTSLTQGRWLPSFGSLPSVLAADEQLAHDATPDHSLASAPVGLELAAAFRSNGSTATSATADWARWRGLTNALSGLFGASIVELDRTLTISPEFAFPLTLDRNEPMLANTRTWYGALPREVVCTENLTPWIRLLPCRDVEGLGSLLNPIVMYDVDYHRMMTLVERTPDNNALRLEQSLTVVMDAKRSRHAIKEIKQLAEKGAPRCPLATTSHLVLKNDSLVSGTAAAHEGLDELQAHEQALVALANSVYVQKHVVGAVSGRKGEVIIEISIAASSATSTLRVLLLDYAPWYFTVYFHTISLQLNGRPVRLDQVATRTKFVPSEDHGRANVIELDLAIPISADSATKLTLSFVFEKALLRWTEYPPDAHRGHDLPSACATILLPTAAPGAQQSRMASVRRVYSESALVSLPTPDFSMPYNVITMSCTAIATFFGSMLRLLTRDHSPLAAGDTLNDQRMVVRILNRLLRLLGVRQAQPATPTPSSEEQEHSTEQALAAAAAATATS